MVRDNPHSVSVFHSHTTGRVEVTCDGRVECGRTSKFLDNGMSLSFSIGADHVKATCHVKPSMMSFKYQLVVNGNEIAPRLVGLSRIVRFCPGSVKKFPLSLGLQRI